jgi:hypothetical protein
VSEAPVQFFVVRTGVDEFKIGVQSERSILKTYQTSFAGARNSIVQELLALEIGPGRDGGNGEPNA